MIKRTGVVTFVGVLPGYHESAFYGITDDDPRQDETIVHHSRVPQRLSVGDRVDFEHVTIDSYPHVGLIDVPRVTQVLL